MDDMFDFGVEVANTEVKKEIKRELIKYQNFETRRLNEAHDSTLTGYRFNVEELNRMDEECVENYLSHSEEGIR